jgi:hypothetical protein
VVETVAGCVDIVVHLVTEPDGSGQVREIVATSSRAARVVSPSLLAAASRRRVSSLANLAQTASSRAISAP